MTGTVYFALSNFFQHSVDGKHLIGFQCENAAYIFFLAQC